MAQGRAVARQLRIQRQRPDRRGPHPGATESTATRLAAGGRRSDARSTIRGSAQGGRPPLEITVDLGAMGRCVSPLQSDRRRGDAGLDRVDCRRAARRRLEVYDELRLQHGRRPGHRLPAHSRFAITSKKSRRKDAAPLCVCAEVYNSSQVADNLNPQLEQMADESMVRNLAAQAVAIWPQERELFLRKPVPATGRILDAGCGTGEISSRLAALFPDATVDAVDIIDSHLDRARRSYPHLADRLRFAH